MPRSSFFWSVAAILGDVVVVVVARRTRPRAMPLATMTMKTQTHGFLNFYLRTVVMGLRSAALRAAGELRYNHSGLLIGDRHSHPIVIALVSGSSGSELHGRPMVVFCRTRVKRLSTRTASAGIHFNRSMAFEDCRLLAVSIHCILLAVNCSLAVCDNTILLCKRLKSNHSLQSAKFVMSDTALQLNGPKPIGVCPKEHVLLSGFLCCVSGNKDSNLTQ